MAIPKKTAAGTWRVQIKLRRSGVVLRDSGTFDTQREAKEWSARREAELSASTPQKQSTIKTLGDAMDSYAATVAPTHKGSRWELIRVEKLRRELPVTLPLSALQPEHISTWRDAALKRLSPSSVSREMNVISSVLTHARKDMRWMSVNIMSDVRRPKKAPHRKRVLTWREIRAVMRALRYKTGAPPKTRTQQVAYALMIALRTGMRSGEILGLEWDHVGAKSIKLDETKNSDARSVPLMPQVRRILAVMRSSGSVRPFSISDGVRDTLWRRYKPLAGLDDVQFHDSRHTAATIVGARVGRATTLTFPEFCAAFGWRDPKYAMVYCNPDADRVADRMR